ncbi:MAG: helix-turn-helix transcriptional regulator [Hyphomicrobiales bacterium]|jgi:transcriptional regulator with XRE-family HTH domain|nr:helix-turn-helix transcriptional regulator [Hyphomicrobiales bacterium]
MVLVNQIKAARALLGWTAKDLAEASKVSLPTIKRLETQIGIVNCNPRTLFDIMRAFNDAGIEFTGSEENGPGVRIKAKR